MCGFMLLLLLLLLCDLLFLPLKSSSAPSVFKNEERKRESRVQHASRIHMEKEKRKETKPPNAVQSAQNQSKLFSIERERGMIKKKPNQKINFALLTFGHDVESSRPASRPHRNLFLFVSSFSHSIVVVVVAIPIVVPFSRFASFSHYYYY